MREINLLLVGLGGMGKVHYHNIKKLNTANIVASVGNGSKDEEEARSLGLPLYSSIGEAVENHPEINVVDITTPTFLHFQHVNEALDLKRDVICEKPLSLKSEEARFLFDKARDNGLYLHVAHVLRYTKEFNILKDLVDNKIFGNVLDASFTRLSACPFWAKDGWLFDKSKSGMIPFDLHIHDLDMIYSLFHEPKAIRTYKRSSNPDFTEYYHMEYEYDDFTVKAEAGWLNASNPFIANFRVLFEKALLINDGNGSVVAYPVGKNEIKYDVSYPVVVSTGINVPPTGWYYEELKYILNCLENNSESLVKAEEVIGELEILESM